MKLSHRIRDKNIRTDFRCGNISAGGHPFHKSKICLRPALFLLFSLIIPARTAAEDYSSWDYCAPIVLNTKSSGADVSGTVSNFPVLIRITASNKPSADFFSSQTQSNGQDIRFSRTSDHTHHFPYEIERWDSAGALAEIWVLVDAVSGNDSSAYLRMYWGNGSASDSSDGETVFATSNGFAAVWHLNEDPSGGFNTVEDRTANNNHGTASGSMLSEDLVDGIIGKDLDFDGNNDYLNAGKDSSLNSDGSSFTLSAWVKITSGSGYGTIFDKCKDGVNPGDGGYTLYYRTSNPYLRMAVQDNDGDFAHQVTAATDIRDDNWHYVTGIWDNSAKAVSSWVDAVKQGETVDASVGTMSEADSYDLNIGSKYHNGSPTEFLAGLVGEARISNVKRSADWIKLCYMNQRSDDSLTAIGEAQLIIPPDVSFDSLYTNDRTPELNGSINDITATITLKVGEQTDTAINNGDGTWTLPDGSLDSLPVDSNLVIVTAKNLLGTDTDSGWVAVDVTPPAVAELWPEGMITSLKPEVSLVFSKPVEPDSGRISLYSAGVTEPVDEVDVTGGRLKAVGPFKFKFELQDSLKAGTGYFIRVDSGSFQDKAGNLFPGISGDTAWSFTTASQGAPVIDSVTSPSAEGLYRKGDTIRLTLHFSHPMTLRGGNLNIQLRTNSDNGKIAVEKMDNATSCTRAYVVQPGDSVSALSIESLSLDSDAALLNGEGKALFLAVGEEAALPTRKIIHLDGIPPAVMGFSPASNTVVVQPYVSYTLNETLLSGKVEWQALTGESVHTHSLSESDLAAGRHEVDIDGSSLERDVQYSVRITVVDSAGNEGHVHSDQVLLFSGIKGIRIVPHDTELSLDSAVRFTAEGVLDADSERWAALDKVAWSVQGSGAIDGDGVFQARALGRNRVIALHNEYSDTATVLVNAGFATIGAKGNDTVRLGGNIALALPELPELDETVLHASYLESALQPAEMRMAGPAVAFGEGSLALAEAGKPVILRLGIDNSLQDSASLDSVRVYTRPAGSQGLWCWVEARRRGAWLELVQDTLQTYIAAIDTRKPTVKLEGEIGPVKAGEDLPIRWNASDNIANPRVYLRLHQGGKRQDSLFPLPYEKDAVKNWELPGEFVSAEGLWYCIEAWDGLHRVAGKIVDVPVEITEKVASKNELREGAYQMISFPLNIVEKKVGKVLEGLGEHNTSRWRLFAWNDKWQEMGKNSVIQPGRAYWLRTEGFVPEIGIASGEARSCNVSNPHEVSLQPEWNCISNPFLFPVNKKQVLLNDEPVRDIYEYDNGEWIISDKISFLAPWKGYAVWNGKDKTAAAKKLSIRPMKYSEPPAKKAAPSPRGSGISISAISGGFHAGRLELGFNYEDCLAGKDDRDRTKPPTPKNPLDISLSVPWEKTPYLADFRGPMHRGESWQIVVMNGTNESLVLKFSGLTALPEGIHAVLMDRSCGKIHSLRQSGLALGKRAADAESLLVAVGDNAYLEERTAVFEQRFLPFSLANNCPNPFRTGTAFSFTLPYTKGHAGDYQVTLSLYNIKGCLAGTVLRSKLPPGRHRFFWRRPAGMPTGVYFYRLEAGRFMAQNKMLILQ